MAVKRTIRGKTFTFDKAEIERKMRGIEPEDINKYGVFINKIEYPLRQVYGTHTGLPPQAYTTQDAYRALEPLFEVKYYPAGKGK